MTLDTRMSIDLPQEENIPSQLTGADRWVMWRAEKAGGNLTKIPYQTNGSKADSTDPATWTEYGMASATLATHPDQFSGIGFVLGNGFCGVDLDDCIVDGQILPYAQAIVDQFNTYTEISPSGTGVKLFLYADPLPPTANKGGTGRRVFNPTPERSGKIEMYSEDRFFTVTGNELAGVLSPTVEQRPNQFLNLYNHLCGAKKKAKPAAAPATDLDDNRVIELGCNASNGGKFSRLLSGNTSDYGDDESSADAAFCCLLAFFTRDANQIDRIFRRSGLCRDKWTEREDYRRSTIAFALESVTEQYKRNGHSVNGKPRTAYQHQPAEAKRESGSLSTSFEPVLVNLSTIDPIAIKWLWKGRIPKGRMVLIVGRPGEGKSFATMDFAARISTGTPWPDGEECERGSVLLVCGEDDPADTIRPRLDACGADATKIILLSMVARTDADGKRHETVFTLEDVMALEKAVAQIPDLKAIIVDPIGGLIGGKVDAHRDNEVRAVLAPAVAIASNHPSCPAIICVAHRRKAAGDAADDLVLGSRAFSGLARATWHISRDPVNPVRRLMLPGKNNLSAQVDGLAFTIGGDPAKVMWERDAVTMSADDALASENRGDNGSEQDEAATFLRSELADMQEHAVDDLRKAAKDAGLAWRTVQRAANAVKVKRHRAGFGKGFIWRLPKSTEEMQRANHANRAKPVLTDTLGTNGTNGISTVQYRTNITPGFPIVPSYELGTDDGDYARLEREAIQAEGGAL